MAKVSASASLHCDRVPSGNTVDSRAETVFTEDMSETLKTTDQNTGREITWNVFYDEPAGPNVSRYGWTHCLGVSRPKGRKAYTIWVEKNEQGEIVRASSPTKAF